MLNVKTFVFVKTMLKETCTFIKEKTCLIKMFIINLNTKFIPSVCNNPRVYSKSRIAFDFFFHVCRETCSAALIRGHAVSLVLCSYSRIIFSQHNYIK